MLEFKCDVQIQIVHYNVMPPVSNFFLHNNSMQLQQVQYS